MLTAKDSNNLKILRYFVNKYINIIFRIAPTIFSVTIFSLFVIMYIWDRDLYKFLLNASGIHPYSHPFIDSEFMYSMKKCWEDGVNIYINVPCDGVPGNKMAYSPIWPRLPILSSDKAVTVPIAILTDLFLLGSICVLPPAKSVRDLVLISLGSISTMVVFAIERNNIDVWIYDILMISVILIKRKGILNYAGYATAIAATLLKYYPIMFFGLLIKEKIHKIALISIILILSIILFIIGFWPELKIEARNIPRGSPFGDLVGLENLPRMVAEMLQVMFAWSAPAVARTGLALRVALACLVAYVAAVRSLRPGLARALEAMPAGDGIWLMFGCLVIGGCYLAGQNVGYRGVYLLPVVSGFLALARSAADPATATAAHRTALLTVLAMWMEGVRLWLPGIAAVLPLGSSPVQVVALLAWLGREAAWIEIEIAMLSIILAWSAQSPVGRLALGRLMRRSPPGAAQRRS